MQEYQDWQNRVSRKWEKVDWNIFTGTRKHNITSFTGEFLILASYSCPMSTIPFDFANRIDASIKKSNFYIKWYRNFSNWRSDCWSWCKQGSNIDHYPWKYSTSNFERKRWTINVLLLFPRLRHLCRYLAVTWRAGYAPYNMTVNYLRLSSI